MQVSELTKLRSAVKAKGWLASLRGDPSPAHPRHFQSASSVGNRKSIPVGTRKMVNYA